jgi:hypothetical protein
LKIKGPIQVLASALEKHNYINLTFETNANNGLKRMYLNFLILFLYLLFGDPNVCSMELLFGLLYHAFTHQEIKAFFQVFSNLKSL